MTRELREVELRKLMTTDRERLLQIYKDRCLTPGEVPQVGMLYSQMVVKILDKEFPQPTA